MTTATLNREQAELLTLAIAKTRDHLEAFDVREAESTLWSMMEVLNEVDEAVDLAAVDARYNLGIDYWEAGDWSEWCITTEEICQLVENLLPEPETVHKGRLYIFVEGAPLALRKRLATVAATGNLLVLKHVLSLLFAKRMCVDGYHFFTARSR